MLWFPRPLIFRHRAKHQIPGGLARPSRPNGQPVASSCPRGSGGWWRRVHYGFSGRAAEGAVIDQESSCCRTPVCTTRSSTSVTSDG
jgi:hypothetical protein